MSAITIRQMADRVAELLESRLHIHGATLADRLRISGRKLPRAVRAAVGLLADAERMAQNPKQLARMNHAKVAESYDICVQYLNKIKPESRNVERLRVLVRAIGLSIASVAALVAIVLYWRGFL